MLRGAAFRLRVTITERKASNLVRDQGRQKRGGGKVRVEPRLQDSEGSTGGGGLDGIVGREPTPELAAALIETLGRVLGILDPDLRQIAVLKLEGRSNEEIASRIDRSLATVERRLRLIRDTWEGLEIRS